jgi:hypothetical protein
MNDVRPRTAASMMPVAEETLAVVTNASTAYVA